MSCAAFSSWSSVGSETKNQEAWATDGAWAGEGGGRPGQSDRNLLSACRVVGAGCVPGYFPWRQLSVLAVCSVSADSGKAALWPFLPVLPPC